MARRGADLFPWFKSVGRDIALINTGTLIIEADYYADVALLEIAYGRGMLSWPARTKSKKTQGPVIYHSEVVKVECVREDWTFKGYEKYVIQDLRIEPENSCYLLEQGEKPDGAYVTAKGAVGRALLSDLGQLEKAAFGIAGGSGN